MSNMSGQEEMLPQNDVVAQEETEAGNEPDPKPLSETGYQVNPDGSVSAPGTKWDKE